MKQNTIYVGGGFIEQQYPYILPIIFKYCENNNIKKIIFEQPPSSKFYQNKYLSKNLKKYIILNQQQIIPPFFRNKFLRFLFVSPKALIYALNLKRSNILNEKNFFKSEFNHAAWDTTLNISKNYLNPSLFIKILSSIKMYEIKMITKYLKKENLKAIFLNHSCYFYRAMLAEFRKDKKIQLFGQADFNIHHHETFKDSNPTMLKKIYAKYLKKKIKKRDVINYWKKRLSGYSIYESANDAHKKIKNVKNYEIPKNILMLHVFKDSSYGYLDKNRLFVDYADWLSFTLKIISNSKQTWGIKFHPIAKRWGENSHNIFQMFIDDLFEGKLPRNFKLINDEVSNYKIMQNADRLVTYWGTCHIESACFGLKPITARETQLSYYDKNLVLYPKNLKIYKKLLLTEENNIFKLKKNQIHTSRFLLYLREKVLNFVQDVNQHAITRGDSLRYINKNLKKNIQNIEKHKKFLENNGDILSSNFSHTVTKKYIQIIKKKYCD